MRPARIWRQRHAHLVARPELDDLQWIVETNKIRADDMDVALGRLLESVWPAREAIRASVREWGLRAYFSCSVKFTRDRPAYRVSAGSLQRLAFFGYDLELDVFDLSE